MTIVKYVGYWVVVWNIIWISLFILIWLMWIFDQEDISDEGGMSDDEYNPWWSRNEMFDEEIMVRHMNNRHMTQITKQLCHTLILSG